jgi:hypothetical protein
MYMDEGNDPEVIWDHLLSRQPERVQSAFQCLSSQEQRAVLTHLQRMANEPGWHPEQCISARAAFQALSEGFD